MVFGFDETAMAYDLQRAHSADVWFIKARAWFWGITLTVAGLLAGNILGVFGVNFFGGLFSGIAHLWSML
tara:strand:+ start:282 stop:491 length:210 start_codon:yes stop_codon:yes gene_type:complete